MIMGIIMIINGYYQWVLISTFGPWYKSLDLYLVNFYVSIQQFEALSPRNPLIYAAVYARGSSY